jgi:hypothetical protein
MTTPHWRQPISTSSETAAAPIHCRHAVRSGPWRLAEQSGLPSTAYAEYLAVCRLQADGLITLDRDLLSIADGVVPLVEVAALEAG